jgi:predicted PurR-regulated permease PerM
MIAREFSNGILRTIAILLSIAFVLFLCYQLSTIIVYLLIAVVFSLIANPIVRFLRNKLKFKNTLAVISTLLFFIVFIISFIMLFVPLLLSQGQNLSLLDINSLEANYYNILESIKIYLAQHNIDINHLIATSNLTSSLNFEFIPKIFNGILSTVGSFGMGLASVFFISFFLLKENDEVYIAFTNILPKKQKIKIIDSLSKIKELLSRYFIGLLVQLTIILILYIIVFLIFGIQNAFIIALLCAVLNIIPYVGPLLGMIVASILILISGIGSDFVNETIPNLSYVLIGMFIVQLIDNNLSQPIIFSKSTKSHPLEIFLVILASGILFGITGMIIAVPTYTALKVIAKAFFPNNSLIKQLTEHI